MREMISYLSEGRLFVSGSNGEFTEIENQFAIKARIRELEIIKKKEWKTTGTGAKFMGAALPGQFDNEGMTKTNIGGMTYSPLQKGIVYSMDSTSFGGLFAYDLKSRSENRLFHKESFSVKDLDCDQASGQIICSMNSAEGGSNIAIVDRNITGADQITEGDSIDEMPRWIPGGNNSIVFQSAGIARSREGYRVGTGNYCILKLDLSSGEMTTLLENGKYDYLLPCIDAKGNLYCIRRLYRNESKGGMDLFNIVKDLVLFPVRLVRTLVSYLNLQSLIYSKEPLITAGTNKVKDIDHKALFLHGRLVEIRKNLVKGAEKDGLVPRDWELVRIDGDGTHVLAKGVVSFDLGPDGTIVYTNGKTIFTMQHDGSAAKIHKGTFIEKIRIFRTDSEQ